jgi:hypothetical protein
VKEIFWKFFGKKGVLVFMSMNLRDTIKRILKEDLGNTRLGNQKRLIERLLVINSYEGVCGFVVVEDKINNVVSAVIIKFSIDWYISKHKSGEIIDKERLKQKTKDEVEKTIKRYLRIKNLYIGDLWSDCSSSSGDK